MKELNKDHILTSLKNEWKQTGQAWKIFIAHPFGFGSTPKETKLLIIQLNDFLKILVLGVLFLIPFGSFLVTGLIRIATKAGIKILPSSFYK